MKIRRQVTLFITVSFFLYLVPLSALLVVGGTIGRLYRLEYNVAELKSTMFRLNYLVRSLFVTAGYPVDELGKQISLARVEFDRNLSGIEEHPMGLNSSETFRESIAITKRLWSISEANILALEQILKEMAQSGIDRRRGLDVSLSEYSSLLTTTDIARNKDHYYMVRSQNLIDSVIIEADTYSTILLDASELIAAEIQRRIRLISLMIGLSLTVFGVGSFFFALNFSRESLVRQIDQLLDEVVVKEKDKQNFQMKMLRYQINPHFLYNTLNSIRFLSQREGAVESAEMIRILSRLLRNTVSSDETLTTVESEIANLQDYMAIMQKRYANRLDFRIECDDSLRSVYLLPFLIQPLVENSILHGLTENIHAEEKDAELTVGFHVHDHKLAVFVRDNGPGMDPHTVEEILNETPSGDSHEIGIKNIHDRLVLAYGESFGVRIASEPGSVTEVSLLLPLLREKETSP